MSKVPIALISLVFGLFFGFNLTKLFHQTREQKSVVLSATFEITSTPSPTSKPTSTPTPTPSSTPTPSPSPTPIPQPLFRPEQIHSFIERFAAQYGVDVNILRHVAVCESGFNQYAINGPYAGLFQFGVSAWTNNRQIMGENNNPDLRLNAEEATQTAAYLISIGKGYMWPNCIP